ncbi:alpha/beta hydrolase [Moraxella sp. Tifton1]|uniref:alpha/beta hydrolase n=1 Tax=Moraxella oculi TaxID=2940516 RepID=UPI00201285A3|nr:alpha/beta hydrolase [Moraxella sp. Tifton1]MCL1623201.1 alpha/beta hydrolase [Moraxella sp. Tifton1]
MCEILPCVIVEHNPANQPIEHAVIWLHGLGASGHDFEPIVPELGLGELPIRFVFPHAPKIPVTINGGYVMPAWYDIIEMTLDRKVDINQIQQSARAIDKLIEKQVANGIPSQNIIIAGFSQGGAVAYHHAFTTPYQLGGLLALSTYFATKNEIADVGINGNILVKIDHGEYDDIVPVILGNQAKALLEKLGLQPKYNTYPMTHQLCLQQVKDIGHWIRTVFKA